MTGRGKTKRIPITIGVTEHWGKGFSSRVLLLLIKRARAIGLKKLEVSGIYVDFYKPAVPYREWDS